MYYNLKIMFEYAIEFSIYNSVILEALWIKEKGEFPFNGKYFNLDDV